MKLCPFSGLPVNYLLLFFFVKSLLLYIYKYFLLNTSHQSFQFYVVESTMAFCGICVVLGKALSIISCISL